MSLSYFLITIFELIHLLSLYKLLASSTVISHPLSNFKIRPVGSNAPLFERKFSEAFSKISPSKYRLPLRFKCINGTPLLDVYSDFWNEKWTHLRAEFGWKPLPSLRENYKRESYSSRPPPDFENIWGLWVRRSAQHSGTIQRPLCVKGIIQRRVPIRFINPDTNVRAAKICCTSRLVVRNPTRQIDSSPQQYLSPLYSRTHTRQRRDQHLRPKTRF